MFSQSCGSFNFARHFCCRGESSRNKIVWQRIIVELRTVSFHLLTIVVKLHFKGRLKQHPQPKKWLVSRQRLIITSCDVDSRYGNAFVVSKLVVDISFLDLQIYSIPLQAIFKQ